MSARVLSLNTPLAAKKKYHKRIFVEPGKCFYIGQSCVRLEMDRIDDVKYIPHLYVDWHGSEGDSQISMRKTFSVCPYFYLKLFICAVEYNECGRPQRLVVELSSKFRELLNIIRL